MARSYESRINRRPSQLKIRAVPSITVVVGSMVTALPIITDYPILPPMGLLMLLAWRLIQPGYWPVWAAFPLGMVDDMFSGQPFGSAAFLWSVVFVALESVDRKVLNRDYWLDWLIVSLAVIFVLIGGMLIVDFPRNLLHLDILIAQIVLSVLLYPFVARLVGAIDSWRIAA